MDLFLLEALPLFDLSERKPNPVTQVRQSNQNQNWMISSRTFNYKLYRFHQLDFEITMLS